MTKREKSLSYQTEQRRYNFVRIWQKRYAHMKARNEGRSTNSSHASGKGMMSQEAFFIWCKEVENMDKFLTLYFEWMSQGFPLYLSPSIDRIYPSRGYTAKNIQWMAFDENCEKNNKHPITHERMRSEDIL